MQANWNLAATVLTPLHIQRQFPNIKVIFIPVYRRQKKKKRHKLNNFISPYTDFTSGKEYVTKIWWRSKHLTARENLQPGRQSINI